MGSSLALERKPRAVTDEVRQSVESLGWFEFDRLSRKGELNLSVLVDMLTQREVTREQADRFKFEDDMSYHIGNLVTAFQIAEHDRLRERWDSLAPGQQRKALDNLTPLSELKRKTYNSLHEGKKP